MVTTPLVVDTGKDAAVPSAAIAFAIWIVDELLGMEFDTVRATVARTPFETAEALRPDRTHVVAPGTLLQVIDLLAAVATGPGVTTADEKSDLE